MHEVPVTEARAEFSELISKVAYGGDPVVITRHGKPLVAVVPASFLQKETSEDVDVPQRSSSPVTVLDVTTREGSESSGPFTVAARQHRPNTR
jgi:prevent-host-death family protein